MYRLAKDIQIRKVPHAQNGDGEVTFYDWLLAEEARGHGRLFSKIVIPPGASIGDHTHHEEFEAFYILEGEALINDNGTQIHLHAGDMHLCAEGDTHGTRNASEDTDLVMLALIMKA